MAIIINVNRVPALYVGTADLTDNARQSVPTFGTEALDATTFADNARRNQPGVQTATWPYQGLYDDATSKSHTLLRDMLDNKRPVSIYMPGDVVGATGLGFGSALVRNYQPGGAVGQLLQLNADIVQDGTFDIIRSLNVGATLYTANFTGTAVDGTAATTAGGIFYVHVWTHTGTAFTANLQDSADNVTYATVGTVTVAVGSGTLIGTAVSFTGTIRRYSRVTYVQDGTAATGTWNAQSGISRK